MDATEIAPGRVHAPRSTEEQLAELDRELEGELNRRRKGNESR